MKTSDKPYVLRWPTSKDIPAIYEVFKQGSANLGGPVFTDTITRYLKSQRILFPVLTFDGVVIGASVSRYPTDGVCYHMLFSIMKGLRGRGLGGQMLRGILELLQPETIKGRPNSWCAHKFFASYPEYNTEVDALYTAMGFVQEGVLRYHTKSRTSLIIRAYYPQDQKLPPVYKKAAPVVSKLLTTLPESWIGYGDLGLVQPSVAQGNDGAIW